MRANRWLIGFFTFFLALILAIFAFTYYIDPFFHYHKPNTTRYYYTLDNERSQNDGISKRFEYDTLITGTSMAANFRTTEVDELWGCNSIKVIYQGGSYKEVNDNVERALKANPDLKMIIRALDATKFFEAWYVMRMELGSYPDYLYDDNPINDIEYLINRDVVFGRAYHIVDGTSHKDFEPGITSFDEYSRWQEAEEFGIQYVYPDGMEVADGAFEERHITEEEKEQIRESVSRNITGVADEYPDVHFYYYYTPYSIAYWNNCKNGGDLARQLEAEEYITSLILEYDNIHLYSFDSRKDIITDLNNYDDTVHYGAWVSSLILKWMHDGKYELTSDNYKQHYSDLYGFLNSYDYLSLNGQVDYEADNFAGALLNRELTGVEPMPVVGTDFSVDLDKGYNYLSFLVDGDAGEEPVVQIYNESDIVVKEMASDELHQDGNLHQYVMDLSLLDGEIRIYLDDEYSFSEVCLY